MPQLAPFDQPFWINQTGAEHDRSETCCQPVNRPTNQRTNEPTNRRGWHLGCSTPWPKRPDGAVTLRALAKRSASLNAKPRGCERERERETLGNCHNHEGSPTSTKFNNQMQIMQSIYTINESINQHRSTMATNTHCEHPKTIFMWDY